MVTLSRSSVLALLVAALIACDGRQPAASAAALNGTPVAQKPSSPAGLYTRFSAMAAYAYTKQVVAFGERPPGSPGHARTQALIREVLSRNGATIAGDDFTAQTPRGPIPVRTIIGKFNVTDAPSQPVIILAGHYDTLFKKGFVGANDGGSSTAVLLAFADALKNQKTTSQIWLVWTDLEEAVVDFTDNDGLYGSRHLAERLRTEGLVRRVKGFFLLDMIGDKDLHVTRETQSTRWLQDLIAQAARRLGYSDYVFRDEMGITDDHVPFLQTGIPAVDVVDANFGRMGPQFDGMGEFHHANTDTIDKVAERSFEIIGRTMLLTVELLDQLGG
jgi:Zn-dependent M28 family amino/carboxypeptidase